MAQTSVRTSPESRSPRAAGARLCAVLAFSVAVAGCPSSPDGNATPSPLEIGVEAPDGSFRPLADGDALRTAAGGMGATLVVLSLRATGIDPRAPEPRVEVDLGAVVVGANLADPRADLRDDGTGYVLSGLRVQFQTDRCCYACSEATVLARLRDNTGKQFEGQVTVQLDAGAGCPDATACCATAGACPAPLVTQVCP